MIVGKSGEKIHCFGEKLIKKKRSPPDPKKWGKYKDLRNIRLRRAETAVFKGVKTLGRGGMEMYGEYEHTVDAKGRMNFPAKLREEFGEHFYICKSFNEKCLTVYTKDGWEELKNGLKGQPSKVALPLERFLFGSACEAEPDKQGRIAIAPALRAYANITSEVVVVGIGDRAEIWDKSSWEEYNNNTPLEAIAGLAEGLSI